MRVRLGLGLVTGLVLSVSMLATGFALGPVSRAAAAASPPATSVVLPSNNAALTGTAYFDAIASAGTSEVQFEITGSGFVNHVIGTATPTIYGWLAAIDTTAFYNGTYTLQSVATSNGLVGTSPGISVSFENPGPAINVVLPSDSAKVAGTQTLDAVTGPGVRQVQFLLGGSGFNDQIIGTGTATIYGWLASWNTTSLPNATFTIQAVADAVRGPNGMSPSVTISVDNPPPVTSVVVPANGSTVSGTMYLDAVASAGVSAGVLFLLKDGQGNIVDESGSVATIYGYLSDMNTTFITNGTFILQSQACYVGGVCGVSAPIAVTVNN